MNILEIMSVFRQQSSQLRHILLIKKEPNTREMIKIACPKYKKITILLKEYFGK